MTRILALERAGGETRLAVLEDGRLCEIYHERGGSAGLAGNIYAGRVQNVLPGMNAAFVDIGSGKNGFLPADDIDGELRPGRMVVVQVDKEPGGGKGPRLTGKLSIPGRATVLLPGLRYAGVSKKITEDGERDRLFGIAKDLSEEYNHGVIVRTEGEGAPEEELRADFARLAQDWRRIEAEALHSASPRLIRSGGDLALKAVRDMLGADVERVRTDDAALYERLKAHAGALTPQYADRVELVETQTPLFDLLRIDHQLEQALARRVHLKSGGNLVIDETEALTVIDVNSAKFTGKRSLRDTILRLNCEAADEIARQLRLRDVGGIVIVDFIDMDSEDDRVALLSHLREAVRFDPNRVNVLGVTALGLVELTRKKERQPLRNQLAHECAACRGSGRVFNHESLAHRAARELWRRRRGGDTTAYRVVTGEKVAGWLRTIGLKDVGPVRVDAAGSDDGFEIIPDEGA